MWELTAERLRELLDYNPFTGLFTNKIQRGKRGPIGAVAGSYDKDGYVIIMISGKKFRAGRLAFLYVEGRWPREIDHVDGIRHHDAWANLRECTRSENTAYSDRPVGESGLRGVKFDERSSTWRARIGFGGYREYLGPFDTKEEAYAAYLKAVDSVHGEFAFHKRPQTSFRRI
jgi:hypothetical protein